VVFVAGCSSSSPKGGINTFAGSWTFTSGTLSGTGTCPGLPTDLAGQTFMVEKGTTSDLSFLLSTCMVTLSVDGSRASADPASQTCMFTVTGLGAVPVTITSWTLDSSNGQTLTTNAMGNALGGACNFTLTGTATKNAGVDGSAG
jgi:hypothetical protein